MAVALIVLADTVVQPPLCVVATLLWEDGVLGEIARLAGRAQTLAADGLAIGAAVAVAARATALARACTVHRVAEEAVEVPE